MHGDITAENIYLNPADHMQVGSSAVQVGLRNRIPRFMRLGSAACAVLRQVLWCRTVGL